jgi:hypothetical protein
MEREAIIDSKVEEIPVIGELVDTAEVIYDAVELVYDVAKILYDAYEFVENYYENITNIAALPSSNCLGAVYTTSNPEAIINNWTFFSNISRPSVYTGTSSSS